MCTCVHFPKQLLYLLVSLKQVDRELADSNTSNSCMFLKIGGSVKQTGLLTADMMESLKAVLCLCYVPEKGHELNSEM